MDRVEYRYDNGIELYSDNIEPDIIFPIIETPDGPALTVRPLVAHPDITPETARHLAAALHKFADQYQPHHQSVGLRLFGIEYPQADTIVSSRDADEAKRGVQVARERGYVATNGTIVKDAHLIAASVYPQWERLDT